MPEAPATVKANPVALAEWNLAAPQMQQMGILSAHHRWLLAGFCITVSRLVEAQAILEEKGLTQPIETRTITRRDGSEEIIERGDQRRPEIAIVSDCTAQIKAYMAELCITPASQSKAVAKTPEKTADKKKRFFA